MKSIKYVKNICYEYSDDVAYNLEEREINMIIHKKYMKDFLSKIKHTGWGIKRSNKQYFIYTLALSRVF